MWEERLLQGEEEEEELEIASEVSVTIVHSTYSWMDGRGAV